VRSLLLHPDCDFRPAPALEDEVFAAMLSGSVTDLARVKQEYGRRHSGAEPPLPAIETMLCDDLELATLWNTMGGGDEFVYETVRRVVLSGVQDADVIRYRQAVLADCLANPEVARQMYGLALDALRNIRRAGSAHTNSGPAYMLARNVALLRQHITSVRRLRDLAVANAPRFKSRGLRRFADAIATELDDRYLAQLEAALNDLEFPGGIVVTAGIGAEDATADFVVHRPPPRAISNWTDRLVNARREISGFSFEVDQSDEDSTQELQWLRGKALSEISEVVVGASLQIQQFLTALRLDLAFYLGALNLSVELSRKGTPLCFPQPTAEAAALSAQDLREVCLILRTRRQVVGSDFSADGKRLIVITGANEGGKSTALRSLGLAQLMMQSGMFVAARRYRASVQAGLFTHFRRPEDAALASGKLVEELARMRDITAVIRRGSVLLCNESFAATNEREGSEIARQVVNAMLAKGIRVIAVTHLYEFARHFHDEQPDGALFLRPEREPDGRRTYRMLEGEPLPTSFGEDSFQRIFGPRRQPAAPSVG
jgi:ABC-type lipoprotein export system ATPase subunit